MSAARSEPLTPAQTEALKRVIALLVDERASVTSVRDPGRAWRVHVEDSLTGLEIPELRNARRIADIGSGAGFPGLVLAQALPAASVDMIESVGRKCAFISRAVEVTATANAQVLCSRSEEVALAAGRESYDAVTARAVGRLSTLAELASPLLCENGVLVAWKGRRDPEEEAEAERGAERVAMRAEAVIDVGDRAGSRHRHLHVLRKTGPTPEGLPRRAGSAKKRPFGAHRSSP